MKIDQDQVSPLEKILDPTASWADFDEEALIEVCRDVVKYKKRSDIILGRAAIIQEKLKSHGSLKYFAEEVEVSYSSLRSFKSIEERLQGLEVPDDLSGKARQLIAQSDNPKEVVDHILKDGMTNKMVLRWLLPKENKHRTLICPNCSKEITL